MNDYISFGYRPTKTQVLKDWQSAASKADTAIGHALGLACETKLEELLKPKLPVKFLAKNTKKRKATAVPSEYTFNHRTHQVEPKRFFMF